MPAQVRSQDPKSKELFHRAIKAKTEWTKSRVPDNHDDEVASRAALALRPLVTVTHDILTARDN